MKKDLEEKLYSDFPTLFIEKDLPPTETCMCFGIGVGDGWYQILYDMCEKLTKVEGFEKLKFEQIKEKFGMLTVYTNKATHEMYDIISAAERESCKTCEYCGSKEDITREGSWIKTLCGSCRKTGRTWREDV